MIKSCRSVPSVVSLFLLLALAGPLGATPPPLPGAVPLAEWPLEPAAGGLACGGPAAGEAPGPVCSAGAGAGESLESLLEPGPLPEGTADPEEPPLLARPDATLHRYGEAVPRVRCIPYRACTVLLHPDERILHLALGDSERWQLETFAAEGTAPALVVKPVRANLLTNLVIKTDRRLYVLELLAPAPAATDPRSGDVAYDALTAFRYPRQWAQQVAAARGGPEVRRREGAPGGSGRVGRVGRVGAAPGSVDRAGGDGGAGGDVREAEPTDPRRLHFEYSFDRPLWPKHRLSWEPEVVYDDGRRTYVRLPAEARRHDLPAVLEVGPGGEPAPVDASLGGPRSDWLVIPVVAERLRLVSRSGDTVRRLTLVRGR
jgi:type IV secretion system protein VirB9